MSKDKITISEIIDLMAEDQRFSKKQTEEFVKMLLSTVEEVLMDGEIVKIKDFGTFKPQWNEPRKSVDVNTGNEIIIPGYYKVTFAPDVRFKDEINEPFAHLESVELNDDNTKNESEDEEFDKKIEETNVRTEPMRMFEEQANEISKLLMEIESLSPQKPLDQNGEVDFDESDEAGISEEETEEIIDAQPITEKEMNEVPLNEDESNAKTEETAENIEKTAEEIIKEEAEDIYDYADATQEEQDEDDEDDKDEEDDVDDLDSSIPLSYLDREMHKKRKKLKKKKAKQQRLQEIQEYFETNDFDIVRKVKDLEIPVPLSTVLPETKADEHSFTEEPVEEKEVQDESVQGNIVENEENEVASQVVSLAEETEVEEIPVPVAETLTETPAVLQDKQDDLSEASDISLSEGIEGDTVTETLAEDDDVEYTFVQKKKRTLWWLLILVLLVAAAAFAVCKFVPNVQDNIEYYYNKFDKKYIHPAPVSALETKNTDVAEIVPPKTILFDSIFLKKRNYDEIANTVVIKQGETLKILAKKYIGDESYWVYVYEANKKSIQDLSSIPVGTIIQIPKLDSALVDIKNPATIEYAKVFALDSLHYTE